MTTRGLALALLAAAALPGGASAQRAVAAAPRTGATLVAATVVIPTGSANDPEDLPGTARLVADAVGRTVRWRLDPDAARLEVRVERGWTAFTLLATPDVWSEAWDVVEDVVFRLPLTTPPIEAARTAIAEGFAFDDGAPVREFQRELYYALAGASSPWSHDPRGTLAAVRKIEPGVVEEFRARYYLTARASAAAVGPFEEAAALRALDPIGAGPLPVPPLDDRVAWEDGHRVPLERAVTNSWIGVLFPAPAELPRTHLEFVEHEIREALHPSPPDPGLYSADVRIEDTPKGPVLLVEAAVVPEAAGGWERRILATIDAMKREQQGAQFTFKRRQFRNATLLSEGQPEQMALRMALDLQREGRVRPLQDEVWEVGPHELAEAAQQLAEPRVIVMGPELP